MPLISFIINHNTHKMIRRTINPIVKLHIIITINILIIKIHNNNIVTLDKTIPRIIHYRQNNNIIMKTDIILLYSLYCTIQLNGLYYNFSLMLDYCYIICVYCWWHNLSSQVLQLHTYKLNKLSICVHYFTVSICILLCLNLMLFPSSVVVRSCDVVGVGSTRSGRPCCPQLKQSSVYTANRKWNRFPYNFFIFTDMLKGR